MVNEYFRELHNYILESRKAGKYAEMYLAKYISKILNDAKLLVKLRLVKSITGFDIEKNSIDEEILKSIKEAVENISKYLAGIYLVTPDGRIVVRIEKDTIINGIRYKKGDLTVIDLKSLVFYSALNIVKPIESLIAGIFSELK